MLGYTQPSGLRARSFADITDAHVDYSAEPKTLTEAKKQGFAYLDSALAVPATV